MPSSNFTQEQDYRSSVAALPRTWAPALSHRHALLLIVLAAAAFRLPTLFFGALNYDEAVYTLVASAMKQGAWPYVDLFDRKPIGLFLLFGFAETIFRDGVVGPRLLGGGATIASALWLYMFTRRYISADTRAAAAAGLFFAAFTILFGGDAAQAPVFYTPLVIAAACLVAYELTRLSARRIVRPARLGAAGLVLGIALQIKYSMVFECIGFGGLLMACGAGRWASWSAPARTAFLQGVALMIAGGLAPTVAVGAVYLANGHFDAWIFYNFTVNFAREISDYSRRDILERIAQFALSMLPLASLAGLYVWDRRAAFQGVRRRRWGRTEWIHALLIVWAVMAVLGGLALRQPYGHYFYGVLPPLAILAGGALDRPGQGVVRGGLVLLLGFLCFSGAAYGFGWSHEIRKNGSPFLVYRMAEDMRAANPRSLYVFNHFGILYELTGHPLPTKYPQPGHLTRELEAHSFGFDGKAELLRVLRTRPEMIVLMRPYSRTVAQNRIDLLEHVVRSHYCTWSIYPAGRHTASVYRRKARGETTCPVTPESNAAR